jgi:hypothetical protein
VSAVNAMVGDMVTRTLIGQREAGLDEGCLWETHGGRPMCTTHQQLGQRVGLGKLYRVVTTEGTQLVRAPDPATAKAAVHGLGPDAFVERALPHEADGRDDVIETRAIVHRRPIPPSRRAPPRPWAEPQPRQFADSPSTPIACGLSGWERGIAPSFWSRGVGRLTHLLRRATVTETRT